MTTDAISNSQFLSTVGRSKRPGTFLWVTHFDGDPNRAKGQEWGGTVYIPSVMAKQVDEWGEQNTYFSVAGLKPDENGEIFRRKDYFDRLLVLVADDVELDDLNGSVSYVITTSPGKHQVGILIDTTDADAQSTVLVDAIVKGMVSKGYLKADTSGNNRVRYVRMPEGTNQKPRESGHFPHSLDVWRPDVVLSLRDAAAVFGVTDVESLLVEERTKVDAGGEFGKQSDNLRDWVKDVMSGSGFHDNLNAIAMSVMATGMQPGAAVNLLRGLMESSNHARDHRWQARYDDIPRAVTTAQEKIVLRPEVVSHASDTRTGSQLDYVHAAQIELNDEQFDDELVERVLTRDGMSVIYGDSNSGKTFLAVHLAACVARGERFLGKRTDSGMVLYLATEAAGSVVRRLKAFKKHHNIQSLDVVVVKSPINFFDGAEDTKKIYDLTKQLESQYNKKVVMVVGDTMARISAGANENSGQDMGVILKHADYIKNECETHFLWIHHNGKNAAAGMRGWSGIRAAIDTEIEVIEDKDSGVRTIEITKQRDIEGKGDRYAFKLLPIDIGVSQWGVIRTSCVVIEAEAVPPKPVKGKTDSPTERAVLAVLKDKGEPMSRPRIRDVLVPTGKSVSGVYAAINSLLESGKLVNDAGMLWVK